MLVSPPQIKKKYKKDRDYEVVSDNRLKCCSFLVIALLIPSHEINISK